MSSSSFLLLAELFLDSLSQPYSLEEQEQMLSCLSIDSPFVSDASEKVRVDGCWGGWGWQDNHLWFTGSSNQCTSGVSHVCCCFLTPEFAVECLGKKPLSLDNWVFRVVVVPLVYCLAWIPFLQLFSCAVYWQEMSSVWIWKNLRSLDPLYAEKVNWRSSDELGPDSCAAQGQGIFRGKD